MPQLDALRKMDDPSFQWIHHGGPKKGRLVVNGQLRHMAKEPLFQLLKTLKNLKYTSKINGHEVDAMAPFMKPVDKTNGDYHAFIRDSMDWFTVDRKIKAISHR